MGVLDVLSEMWPGAGSRGRPVLFAVRVFALLAELGEIDGGPEIFGLLGVLMLLIGALRLIYVLAFKDRRGRPSTPPLAQQTSRIEAPQQHALPAPYAPPVGVPRSRFDTGETVAPPSVTEHTTRHLAQEPPREL